MMLENAHIQVIKVDIQHNIYLRIRNGFFIRDFF
jgi:hypothetical protein